MHRKPLRQDPAMRVDKCQLGPSTRWTNILPRKFWMACPTKKHSSKNSDAVYQKASDSKFRLSLMLIHVDNFRTIATQYGSQVGDLILDAVAQYLQVLIRDMDLLARYSNGQFCIMLPGSSMSDAARVAERIRNAVSSCVIPDSRIEAATHCLPGAGADDRDGRYEFARVADGRSLARGGCWAPTRRACTTVKRVRRSSGRRKPRSRRDRRAARPVSQSGAAPYVATESCLELPPPLHDSLRTPRSAADAPCGSRSVATRPRRRVFACRHARRRAARLSFSPTLCPCAKACAGGRQLCGSEFLRRLGGRSRPATRRLAQFRPAGG